MMRDREGRIQLDFEAAESRARQMSDAALHYSIADAAEAARAMPDGPKAGYYLDEVHVYGAELRRRREGA